jgi:spore maturation protein CgeB
MGELSSSESAVDIPQAICGPALNDEDLIKMYSRSKISLGFPSCGETHEAGQRILQVRLRDFEAPMSGAFYMVEYMEELEEFYQIGKEILCYHDKGDLADKAQYYLIHDVERERISLAGYQRAVNEHSWQKRFEHVFRKIGLTR